MLLHSPWGDKLYQWGAIEDVYPVCDKCHYLLGVG